MMKTQRLEDKLIARAREAVAIKRGEKRPGRVSRRKTSTGRRRSEGAGKAQEL
jgi:hypothetical protein